MEKQPPNITDALLNLNLFSFPLENVHSILLMQTRLLLNSTTALVYSSAISVEPKTILQPNS